MSVKKLCKKHTVIVAKSQSHYKHNKPAEISAIVEGKPYRKMNAFLLMDSNSGCIKSSRYREVLPQEMITLLRYG